MNSTPRIQAGNTPGVRNLRRLFHAVLAALLLLYASLAWQAMRWSPALFISGPGPEISGVYATVPDRWPRAAPRDRSTAVVERGGLFYHHVGCAVCHGLVGHGGVQNPNYAKDTIPRLDNIAERLLLYDPLDAGAVVQHLQEGKSLETIADLDLPRAGVVAAQCQAVRKLILAGNPGGVKDPKGPQPLPMPAWKDRLTEGDVDAILAYLVSLYPWEEPKHE